MPTRIVTEDYHLFFVYLSSWWPEQAFGLETKVWYYLWHSGGSMLPPWRIRNSDHSPGHQSQQRPLGSKAEAKNHRLRACSSPLRWQNASYDRNRWDSVSNTSLPASLLLCCVLFSYTASCPRGQLHKISSSEMAQCAVVTWLQSMLCTDISPTRQMCTASACWLSRSSPGSGVVGRRGLTLGIHF